MLAAYPFWQNFQQYGDAVALIDGDTKHRWTYNQLASAVHNVAEQVTSTNKKLILAPLGNEICDIVLYFGCLAAGHAVIIYPDYVDTAALQDLISVYSPDLFFERQSATKLTNLNDHLRHTKHQLNSSRKGQIHESLGLLLLTSGSSGARKLVRLSYENLTSNAQQIGTALKIGPQARAITTLPLSYVYGLSILHSHLKAGSSLIIESRSIMEREFWQTLRKLAATSFPGVPWTYQIMQKIGVDGNSLPTVSAYTTAGGKTDSLTAQWMIDTFDRADIFYMYGQTEAAGRISVLPPELVREKVGSVGRSVERGQLECLSDGSVIYNGPNVMLGYARCAEDLTLGDEIGGRLDTGDLGYIDPDGCLFITGRKSQICKIFGTRVNLDDIRGCLRLLGVEGHAFELKPNTILIRYEGAALQDSKNELRKLAFRLGIPASSLQIERVDRLERLPNGKIRL